MVLFPIDLIKSTPLTKKMDPYKTTKLISLLLPPGGSPLYVASRAPAIDTGALATPALVVAGTTSVHQAAASAIPTESSNQQALVAAKNLSSNKKISSSSNSSKNQQQQQ